MATTCDLPVELYQLDKEGRDPTDYVGYRFYDLSIRPVLNDPEARVLTDNKWIFYQLFGSLGFPIPRTLALYDGKYGVTADGKPCRSFEQLATVLERERPQGLVIKPAGGIQGRDVVVFDEIDYSTGEATLRTGDEVSLWDEIRRLPQLQRRTGFGYVIQESVSQHPGLSRINPSTANGVRVVTHMTVDGEVVVPFAAVKFGRAGHMADSWRLGAVSAGVDVETGQVKKGQLKPEYGGQWVTAHPDTGVEFVGMTVPMWQDAVELCRRAAQFLPGLRSLGWDLIVSPDGPVLLEANEQWGLIRIQANNEGWLARPGMREDLKAHGIDVPDRVPSIPGVVGQMLKRRVRKLGRALNKVR